MSTTVTQAQALSIPADLGFTVEQEQVPLPTTIVVETTPAQAKRAAATAKHNEIMAHVHAARMARREATQFGGLTSKERKALAAKYETELAAALVTDGGRRVDGGAYDRLWALIVRAAKKA